MKLSSNLAGIFEKEIEKIIQKEKDNPEFLNSDKYANCEERARAGIYMACEQVIKKLALDICLHGINDPNHEYGSQQEFEKLRAELNSEYIESVTRDWWNL